MVLVGAGGVLWRPGLAAVALFAVASFVVPAYAAGSAGRLGATMAGATAALRVAVLDGLTGLREVRIFAAEPRIMEAVRAADESARDVQRALAGRAAVAQAVSFLCAQAAILLLLLGAGVRPVFVAGAVFLVVAAFEATSGLSRAGTLAGHAAAAAKRVLGAAQQGLPVPEPARPATLPPNTALRFEGVHFRYAPDLPDLFDGLTLEVPQGARVAVLGPSGAGKSTLASMLLKVVAPETGRVLLGGVDIATLAASDVRSQIGYLSQATHLFDDTIRANLLLGRPARTRLPCGKRWTLRRSGISSAACRWPG